MKLTRTRSIFFSVATWQSCELHLPKMGQSSGCSSLPLQGEDRGDHFLPLPRLTLDTDVWLNMATLFCFYWCLICIISKGTLEYVSGHPVGATIIVTHRKNTAVVGINCTLMSPWHFLPQHKSKRPLRWKGEIYTSSWAGYQTPTLPLVLEMGKKTKLVLNH